MHRALTHHADKSACALHAKSALWSALLLFGCTHAARTHDVWCHSTLPEHD